MLTPWQAPIHPTASISLSDHIQPRPKLWAACVCLQLEANNPRAHATGYSRPTGWQKVLAGCAGVVCCACHGVVQGVVVLCRMGKVFCFLGLSVAVVTDDTLHSRRKQLFPADVVYITAMQLTFTYLRDNTVHYQNQVVSSFSPNLDQQNLLTT